VNRASRGSVAPARARFRGKGGKVVVIPLPPAVARALDRAVDGRDGGPILCNIHGSRMDRHAATRRLKHLAHIAGIRMPRMHPHILRHTYVTTMLDAGVSLATTTSSPRTWPPEPHDGTERLSRGLSRKRCFRRCR